MARLAALPTRPKRRSWREHILFLSLSWNIVGLFHRSISPPPQLFGNSRPHNTAVSRTHTSVRTLVTYAYAEGLGNGGELDLHNFRYFLKVALSENTPGTTDPESRIDYNIVVSGLRCTPCEDTLPSIIQRSKRDDREWVTILYRENGGLDFGGYNHSIAWTIKHRGLMGYTYFVFINSSLRGPFMPKWTPPGMHYTDTLTGLFRDNPKVKLAGSYISCLPEMEPIPGPILESLFFAVDRESLDWLIQDEAFSIRDSKADAVLFGEYSLMRTVMRRGGFVEGLSIRYAKGIDWRDRSHHSCNDNRHASRRGSLEGGISPNPLEHVFLKTSWCVRATETSVLTNWLTSLSDGKSGTSGSTDIDGYLRGISVEGTSGKHGTLPIEIPIDACHKGDIKSLRVHP